MAPRKKDVKNEVIDAVIIETVKQIPGASILIAGIEKYKETIEENQRIKLIDSISERLSILEQRNNEWYSTADGREFVQKLIATALNAEYIDKVEYFRNMLFNGISTEIEQIEKLKFIEMVAHLSKAALIVLSVTQEIFKQMGPRSSRQIDGQSSINKVIQTTDFSMDLVLSCYNELYAEGVFNSNQFSTGVSAYTELTERFISFLSDPN